MEEEGEAESRAVTMGPLPYQGRGKDGGAEGKHPSGLHGLVRLPIVTQQLRRLPSPPPPYLSLRKE